NFSLGLSQPKLLHAHSTPLDRSYLTSRRPSPDAYPHSLVGAIFWALALNLYSRAGNSGLNGRAHTTVGNHMQTDNDPAARNVSLRIYGGCVPKLDAREQYFRIPNEIESLKLFLRYLSPVSAFTPAKVLLYIHGTDCSRASRLGVGLPWVRWLRSIL